VFSQFRRQPGSYFLYENTSRQVPDIEKQVPVKERMLKALRVQVWEFDNKLIACPKLGRTSSRPAQPFLFEVANSIYVLGRYTNGY
jgi:hypothetical protein